jgi:hypothetical protein
MGIYFNKIGFVFFPTKNKKNGIDETKEINELTDSLICKFVFDGANRKIGESLAVDNDILIIKSGKKYLGVPIKHIEVKEKILLVKGLIELDKAEIMGEKWIKTSFRGNDYFEKKE